MRNAKNKVRLLGIRNRFGLLVTPGWCDSDNGNADSPDLLPRHDIKTTTERIDHHQICFNLFFYFPETISFATMTVHTIVVFAGDHCGPEV